MSGVPPKPVAANGSVHHNANQHVGKPLPHESAREHVTGAALYTDDLYLRFPGILHAWPVMAPHARARIISMDVAPALEVPGVVTTLTGEDAPGEANAGAVRHDEPLFPTEVMHHLQPVAWVLGESLESARLGAERVRVKYEPLLPVLTIEDAIAAESYLSGPIQLTRGDADTMEQSALKISGELKIGGQEHFYLETQCAIARLDETGGMMVDCSTQHPSETQEIVARVLGTHRHQVTVQCIRMGGAFGGKETQANGWAAIAALGAWKTKRPVRVRLTRQLDMALTGKRHPFLAKYQAGFHADGRIAGVRIKLYSDGGWCLDLSDPVLARAMFHCDNTYLLPAVDVTGWVCRTHKTSQTAFRGFGGPQGMLVIEEILDHAARRLGMAPDVIRERNFYREGDTTHYGQDVKHAERIPRIWRQLKESSGFEARRNEIQAFNADSRYEKRGIAITPVKFGISFTATLFNQAGALVLLYRDGTVQVNHGGTEMGQGLHTKMGQVAAEVLGVKAEAVRVMPTRTDKVPNTSASAASASADLNGAAVVDACVQIKRRLTEVAADLLKADATLVQFENGLVLVPGKEAEAIPFAQLTNAAYVRRVCMFSSGYYRTPEIHYDPATLKGRPFLYYVYGAAVAEVEVEAFTGDFRVRRVDILEDAGTSLSPLIDRGQIEGGFVQGMGWLTIEELRWNAKGQLATAGASTYKLPSWSELPEEFHVNFLERAADPDVVFGSKAVGEPPLMLAISVREAIREAVAAFGNGGPVELESPATPERIFFAIRQAKERMKRRVEATGNALPEGATRT
jgi:xanthine dehydrogenase large subunit